MHRKEDSIFVCQFIASTVERTYSHSMTWFHLGNFIRGGSLVIIMKGGHDEMKSRCGFYSKLEYCEGVVEELGGKLES